MLAQANAARGRPSSKPAPSRAIGGWVLLGIPAILVLLFVWQVVSGFLPNQIVAGGAVAISKVSLEPDPRGARVDMVMVDRVGKDTPVNAEVTVKLREPDGRMWQTSRVISSSEFAALPSGGLLAGRVGYSVVVPDSDWVRRPRRGGSATVSITVQPTDGEAFSTVAEERFP